MRYVGGKVLIQRTNSALRQCNTLPKSATREKIKPITDGKKARVAGQWEPGVMWDIAYT